MGDWPKISDRTDMTGEQLQYFLIGMGSNMRHPRYGSPASILRAAAKQLGECGLTVEGMSDIVTSPPLGPSARRYANAACIVSGNLGPQATLSILQGIEADFGRRRNGQRWRQRTLDLDIVMWSGGVHAAGNLIIPHREFRKRDFVLGPARQIAGDWSDPITGLSVRQLFARLTRPRPLPR